MAVAHHAATLRTESVTIVGDAAGPIAGDHGIAQAGPSKSAMHHNDAGGWLIAEHGYRGLAGPLWVGLPEAVPEALPPIPVG